MNCCCCNRVAAHARGAAGAGRRAGLPQACTGAVTTHSSLPPLVPPCLPWSPPHSSLPSFVPPCLPWSNLRRLLPHRHQGPPYPWSDGCFHADPLASVGHGWTRSRLAPASLVRFYFDYLLCRFEFIFIHDVVLGCSTVGTGDVVCCFAVLSPVHVLT